MSQLTPPVIPQAWASDGTKNDIPATTTSYGVASWSKGFPPECAKPLSEGGVPPSYGDFQGVLNVLSQHSVYQQTGARYAWANSVVYPIKAVVLGTDGIVYEAVQENGPGTTPGATNPVTDVNRLVWRVFAPLPQQTEATDGLAVFSNGATAYWYDVRQEFTEDIATETARAEDAEAALQTALDAEVTRATSVEQANAAAISTETTRATIAEQANATAITAETERATSAEQVLTDNLNTEIARATKAEQFNAAAALANKKRISNLEALLSGEVYTEATDSTVAYTKLVGDGTVTGGAEVMPYAGVESVGGKTLVWNQQWRTINRETVYTDASASSMKDFNIHNNENLHPPVSGHKYLVLFSLECSGFENVVANYVDMRFNMPVATVTYSNVNASNIVPALKGEKKTFYWLGTLEGNLHYGGQDFCYLRFWNAENFVGTIRSVANCFDLTLMFGAGNEPATIEEFEAMFPADYYEYNAGTLLSAGITEIKSIGKMRVWNQQWRTINNETVYTDASALSFADFFIHNNENLHPPVSGHKYFVHYSLECSGFENVVMDGASIRFNMSTSTMIDSNGDKANLFSALKGEKKTFYWLGTLEGDIIHGRQDYCYLRFWTVENFVGTINSVANCFDLTLMFGEGNEPTTVEEFKAMFPEDYYPYDAGTENVIGSLPIPDAVQALEGYGWSAGTSKNWIDWEAKVFHREVGSREYAETDASDTTIITDGTTTYYPLEAPELIDISDILTDDNLISVQEGGILTFKNQHGEDFQIPVPSSVSYLCKLSEETTA